MKSLKVFSFVALSYMVMSFNVLPNMLFGNDGYTYEASAIVWKSDIIDLGTIQQGKPVTVQFEFTNTGKEAAIITNVATSCGCTVAEYSKKPIGVNEKSTVTTTYNAANVGAFNKTITVTLAGDETKVLQIKGTVVQ